MNRRYFLAHLGAGTAVVAGGCLGSTDATGPEEPSRSPGATGTATGTPRPTIEGQSCPPYATSHDRAVCSHTVNADTASVYLTPDPQTSPLDDGAPVNEITLHNQFDTDLRFNPSTWRIWRLTDGDWSELEKQWSGHGVVTVPADDTYTWSFMEAVKSIQEEPNLNPGLYAAEIAVPDPDSINDWVGCIALMRFRRPE